MFHEEESVIERHYVSLPGGQLHYLRAGAGAPVIVLHSSPMSSACMTPWIERLAASFTVYALDTAGYGQSDPLPYGGADPEIADYGRRVLEFADAVGLERFMLAGTHTGSKIALSAAVQAPERVAQLVMDGLGLYTVEEMAEQLEHYTPPIEPVWHGGHLTEAWHRMRNMWTFWPWYRQEAGRRLDESMPALADLHQMTFDMLRARPDWGLAYRAAFRYDARAALRDLRVPAVLLAKHADPLHEHLDRLRVEAPTMEVRSVDNATHLDDLVAAFDRGLGLADAPPPPPVEHRGGTTRTYVRTEHGVSHVRLDGDPAAPPLLLVHGSPGSADSFEALIGELARDHLVVSPDTLGNGYSSAPRGEDPRIEEFAAAGAAVLDALGLAGVTAYGSHTGACIALELACQRPDLVASVVADGLPVLGEEERADLLENYFISMEPERHGEHLLRAWHTIRDVQLFWPWYRQTAATARPTAPSQPAHLHRLVMEFLKSGPTYRHSYRAAFLFDSRERLAAVSVPTLVCAAPEDMLRKGSEEVSGEGRVRFVELDHAAGRDAAWAVRQA
nr:alpha/beta hydrolase [Nocardioides sp. zg-DK7169]